MRYDAEDAPDPTEWLGTSELERIDLIRQYHAALRAPHPKTPNPRLHAAFHAVVENQVAAGDELPVRATLERLRSEGLTRHDAIHAIGQILAEQMYDILQDEPSDTDPNPTYFAALEQLTAKAWLNQPPVPRHGSTRRRSKRRRR